jgi:hypothetical protein
MDIFAGAAVSSDDEKRAQNTPIDANIRERFPIRLDPALMRPGSDHW